MKPACPIQSTKSLNDYCYRLRGNTQRRRYLGRSDGDCHCVRPGL